MPHSKICAQCGCVFLGHRNKTTCSATCKLLWRRAYKKQWCALDPQKEKERQREADRRRKRQHDPAAKEARRKYLLERYHKRSDLVHVLKQEMPELLKEFGL